jgi:hypothetical protein
MRDAGRGQNVQAEKDKYLGIGSAHHDMIWCTCKSSFTCRSGIIAWQQTFRIPRLHL